MDQPAFGKIILHEAKSVWKSEPRGFTPWLSDNLDLLAGALKLEKLIKKETEARIGDFKVDLLAEDQDGSPVIIENQFGKSDHTHLGQIVSYFAAQRSLGTAVWVVEQMREEHRSSIDWLNQNTPEGMDFFGIEVLLLQIDQGKLAPYFNVVSKPNYLVKKMVRKDQLNAGATLPIIKEFWDKFQLDYQDKFSLRAPSPKTDNWMSFGIGRTGFYIYVHLNRQNRTRVSIAIRFDGQPELTKIAFQKLHEDKDAIEQQFGMQLDWDDSSKTGTCYIACYLDADPNDRDSWPRHQAWIFERIRDFRRVFETRITELNLPYNS